VLMLGKKKGVGSVCNGLGYTKVQLVGYVRNFFPR
jgi:hypothetical protein